MAASDAARAIVRARRCVVRAIVSEVATCYDEVRVSGSTRMLERTVGKTALAVMGIDALA